eukprot:1694959-Amphidinium_carterae.1
MGKEPFRCGLAFTHCLPFFCGNLEDELCYFENSRRRFVAPSGHLYGTEWDWAFLLPLVLRHSAGT